MSEWQPIETAPRDGGNAILVVDTIHRPRGIYSEVLIARWVERPDDPEFDDFEEYWEVIDPFMGSHVYGFNLTHWMPLPAPPKQGNAP
jgi:hypothetical protein